MTTGDHTGIELPVKRLDPDLPLPEYAHHGDAGLDLFSAVDATVMPGQRTLIPTGIAVSIPVGCAGFVLPRSGSALKKGLGLANSPGLIDSAYRGEIKVIVVNMDRAEPIVISRGAKIAQLVVQRVEQCELREVDSLDDTVRGEGGFGSTGV